MSVLIDSFKKLDLATQPLRQSSEKAANVYLKPVLRAGTTFVFSDLTLQTVFNIWGGQLAKTKIQEANALPLVEQVIRQTKQLLDLQQLSPEQLKQTIDAMVNQTISTYQFNDIPSTRDSLYNAFENLLTNTDGLTNQQLQGILHTLQQGSHHLLEPTTSVIAGLLGAALITVGNVYLNWKHNDFKQKLLDRFNRIEMQILKANT